MIRHATNRWAIPVSIVLTASLVFAPIGLGQSVSGQVAPLLWPVDGPGLPPLPLRIGAPASANLVTREEMRPGWFEPPRSALIRSVAHWLIAGDSLLAANLARGESTLLAQATDSPVGDSVTAPITEAPVGEPQPAEPESAPAGGESGQVNGEPQPSIEAPRPVLSQEPSSGEATLPPADNPLPPEPPPATREEPSWIAKIPWWGWAIAGAVVLGLLASSGGGGGGGGGKGKDPDSGTVGYSW